MTEIDIGLRPVQRRLRQLERLLDLLLDWRQRARDRRRLGAFDERMLKDIGLSRADIDPETRKPFWRS